MAYMSNGKMKLKKARLFYYWWIMVQLAAFDWIVCTCSWSGLREGETLTEQWSRRFSMPFTGSPKKWNKNIVLSHQERKKLTGICDMSTIWIVALSKRNSSYCRKISFTNFSLNFSVGCLLFKIEVI